jgi:hypothetical protein
VKPHALLPQLLLFIVVTAPDAAWSASPFSGTFINAEGERVVLRQTGQQVSGKLISGGASVPVLGQVSRGVLRGQSRTPDGFAFTFLARVSPSGLVVEIDGEAEAFRRVGVAPEQTVGSKTGKVPQRRSPAGEDVPGDVPPIATKGPKAGGRKYRSEYQGWGFRVPKAWKHVVRGDGVAMGSDSEAGLILVMAESATNPAVLQQGLGEALGRMGLKVGSVPRLQSGRFPAGRAVFTEVSGTATDGTRLRVRAVGVLGKTGTVVVLGVTVPAPSKFGTLRRRVDEIARTVHFFKPKVAPGSRFVAGEWWSYTSAALGGGGTEKSLAFCPNGAFYSSSESSYSGGAGTDRAWGVVGQGGADGQWSARGDLRQGVVIVSYKDGSTSEIRYHAKGKNDASFDGRAYGRTGWKRCR